MWITEATSPASTSIKLRPVCAFALFIPPWLGLKGAGKLSGCSEPSTPELAGHLVHGKPASTPRLSLTELDAAISRYIIDTYHSRVNSKIDETPLDAWRSKGFLPRLPESLEELDLLLVMHAKPRTVRRDGIHFQGLRYQHPTMAGYVGDPVTIRYDPRHLSEIRVFYRNEFLCRAVSEEHAGEAVTLKDIQAARRLHRRFVAHDHQ